MLNFLAQNPSFKKKAKKVDKLLDNVKIKQYICDPLLIVAKSFIDIGK